MLVYKEIDSNSRLIALLARNFMHPYVANIFERHGIEKTTESFGYHIQENVKQLVQEIRKDGSHTVMNIFRDPVPYSEVAYDVAKKLGAKIPEDKKDDEQYCEMAAYTCAIDKYLNSLSEKERDEFFTKLGEQLPDKVARSFQHYMAAGASFAGVLLQVAEIAGVDVAKKILVQIMGRQAAIIAGQRIGGLLVPGLNIILTVLLLIDLGGPAFRKTIPTVIEIACLRQMEKLNDVE